MRAGMILCGGKSTRMGLPKASLPFGAETMLQRVARLLNEAVDALIVVAAAGQELPDLPGVVTVVRDQSPDPGPLEGLAAGFSACADRVDAVYATSCDVPFLVPGFVTRMFELIGEHEIAVPCDGRCHHPLAAVYRPAVARHVQRLLQQDKLRPAFLFDMAPTRRVAQAEWADVDPQSATLQNLNRPEDYLCALRQAGLGVPAEVRAGLA